MKAIQEYLETKQKLLAEHSLFRDLKLGDSKLEDFARMASSVGFWVMSFQDLLRINLSFITDEEYYQFIRKHLMEDIGHDKWFLYDLKALNTEQPNLQVLYNQFHTPVRDATFLLMSEVFRANNDYERITLILALESAGHVFFECVADFIKENNCDTSLKYFSSHHLGVEKEHEIFETGMQDLIGNIQLNHEQKIHHLKMIDRIYEAFDLMFDGLAIALSPSAALMVAVS
ncbi:conserved hypothetical protein [Trichormus variabilis ATCC 29413]|uniref:Uncharacterized protein n=2 Tax=Anabaena variabilis TaxID=264691 RepID=Q3M3X0_TRIV2|nr:MULTISPECIES: hypothetical protein [Nostocaceae]ABA24316.1 conserved hypothetical protein [Trichormus variabilis ATCC 29413]MBC1214999.1 hypothetical protein [Trichormus variabilis ARAD]MBC1254078.1 hypothetical protein [Trichormus variabilis V5]MBC1268066.1 hypothetical protein [Trichormus variabilis FSR]MBC1301920.1 hypothetical protein [Trichormus variabilis N2B]